MQQRAYSRVAARTLLRFRACAEGWITREGTCWKPRSKAQYKITSNRPLTIQRTLCNTTGGRTVALRDLMPLIQGARSAPEVEALRKVWWTGCPGPRDSGIDSYLMMVQSYPKSPPLKFGDAQVAPDVPGRDMGGTPLL